MNQTIVPIVLTVFLIWQIGLTVLVVQIIKRYKKLTAGIKKKQLREILENASKQLDKQKQTTDELKKWIERLEEDSKIYVQKVGFVRFNPFTDTGGNQSFCLTLLDQNDDGIIISSLHSREQTRIYAKAIKKGKTEGLELSKEEKEALQRAKSSGK